MKLSIYSEELFSSSIHAYVLTNTTNSQHPKEVIETSKKDRERFPVAISDDLGDLVGFLCLHVGTGPEVYGFSGEEYVMIRSMSIDDRYQNKGYGAKALNNIFEFVRQEISEKITCIVLAVNEKNGMAQRSYEKAGFKRKAEMVEGRLGNLIIMEKYL